MTIYSVPFTTISCPIPFPHLNTIKNRSGSLFSSSAIRSSSASSFPISDMDGSGSSLFPLHRCKTLHLVRHAQGTHNVLGDKDHKVYMSREFFDASLTPLGWSQMKYGKGSCGFSALLDDCILLFQMKYGNGSCGFIRDCVYVMRNWKYETNYLTLNMP